jgi:dTDP-glucose 4,6-dehydratase
MRIVVTGGCGFIGSSFVHFMNQDIYQQQNVEIVVVDKLTYAGNRDNIPDNVEFIQKDICDLTLEDLGDFTHIVNFAAESHVDNSIKDGRPFVRTNVEGTFNLLELARNKEGFRKFVQISTDEVYGDLSLLGKDDSEETDPLIPSSYYSATKASADMLVQSVGHTYGMKYLIIRMCNNFGDRQHSEKFIPKLITCIKNDIPVPVYGDGLQQREWIWVEDSVKYIWLLMQGFGGIYNLGSGYIHTNLRLVQQGRIIRDPLQVDFIQDRKGHDRKYKLSMIKTNKSIHLSMRGFRNIIDYITEKLTEVNEE